jgi:hypothetical protein
MVHRKAAVLVVAVALAVAAAPALAKGPTSSSTTPSISIATINGSGSFAAAKPQPAFEDNVTWSTTLPSTTGSAYPMVDLTCYQDVNGDGVVDTSLHGPDIVYSWLDTPAVTYSLGGYSSIWTQRGGGAATCRANLVTISWKGGKESATIYASTGDFPVSA